MINLIPPAAKKKVVTEYWVRAVSLWGLLGGTAVLVVTTLFVPLNIYIFNQEQYLTTILSSNQAAQDNQTKNTTLLTQANQQAQILLSADAGYLLSALLPVLSETAGENIKLEDISLTQTNSPVLVVSGQATSRQTLVAWRDVLETEESFLTVNLPIGNLIKDRDVPFTITITLATSTPAV